MYRVREVICVPRVKQTLRGKIPKEAIEPPATITERSSSYPLSIIKYINAAEKYSVLGCATEMLLQLPSVEINTTAFLRIFQTHYSQYVIPPNEFSHKGVSRFIDNVRQTRIYMENLVLRLQYNVDLEGDSIMGHPDACNEDNTHIFEIKTSGRIKVCWMDFILQIFSYAALEPAAKYIYLVFPLQACIWKFPLSLWKPEKREAFLKALENAPSLIEPPPDSLSFAKGSILIENFRIGSHIEKKTTIEETLAHRNPLIPYQIFITRNTGIRLSITNEDIIKTAQLIRTRNMRLYIHAPYTINLCNCSHEMRQLLVQHLVIGGSIGSLGVVVHTGKKCNMEHEEAINNMRENIRTIVAESGPHACPLLLETPAGQGTELLTDMREFVDFAVETGIKICLDTCHVFSAGHSPISYIQYILSNVPPNILKLIHFNDSRANCGACLDRHAFLCTGNIGAENLLQFGLIAAENNIDMVIE